MGGKIRRDIQSLRGTILTYVSLGGREGHRSSRGFLWSREVSKKRGRMGGQHNEQASRGEDLGAPGLNEKGRSGYTLSKNLLTPHREGVSRGSPTEKTTQKGSRRKDQ